MEKLQQSLNKIFEKWLSMTGKPVDDNMIRMGNELDWICHEANRSLTDDPSGVLSSLTMVRAYREFLNKNTLTYRDILNGKWSEVKTKIDDFQAEMFTGPVGELYFNFLDLIISSSEKLNKHYTYETIRVIPELEKVMVDALKDFNSKYKLHHERFTQGTPLRCENTRILNKLLKFKSYEDFINSLKQTDEDNFICVALIERTYNTVTDEYYDNNFDMFFAYGFKNNGVVYCVNDRTIFDAPDGAFKTRNPGRNFRDKMDFGHLPYYDFVKNPDKLNTLQLSYNDYKFENNVDSPLYNILGDESFIYSVIIISLIYKKYFLDLDDKTEKLYFHNEVKFITGTENKSLVIKDQLQLTIPETLSIRANSVSKEASNHGYYDYYVDKYCKDLKGLKTPVNFIDTEQNIQDLAWWGARQAQKEHILETLKEDEWLKRRNLCQWFRTLVLNESTAIKVIDIMLSNFKNYDYYKENYYDNIINENGERVGNGKPYLIDLIKSGSNEAYGYKFELETNVKYPFKFDKYTLPERICYCNGQKWGAISYYDGNCIEFALLDNNTANKVTLTLTLNTYADLMKFLEIQRDELPELLQRHNSLSYYGAKPRCGNSILTFVDPMSTFEDPYDEIKFTIRIHMPKSEYNKLKKKNKYQIPVIFS